MKFVLIKKLKCLKILQHPEVLHKFSTGDFFPGNLLFYQSIRGQEERHQLGQLSFKILLYV